jgi:multidrug efflux pump subunit AcrB
VVSIVADVDKSKTTTSIVLEKVKQLLPAIESEFGVRAQFSKQDRYQKDTLPEMRMGSILGLMIIYLVIAWISRSLFWPLVIMVTIPLGVVGAVYGHFILGMNLTLLSLFGIFGLAGIVVNGSIILLLKYQELRRSGVETVEAAIMASCMRFRALMLTTLTTVGGLLPLIFEKSLQAQYLIPMATSLVFGLLVSTAIMLFLIPAIIPYVERFRPISA